MTEAAERTLEQKYFDDLEVRRLRNVSRSVAGRLMREHPTLVLTLAYLGLTFVGMIRDLWFYRYFRINILDYSETSDFLLAAIRNPLVVILSLVPIGMLLLAARIREYAIVRSPKYRARAAKSVARKWNTLAARVVIYTWFVFIYAVLFAQLYSMREVTRIKAGRGQRVALARTDGVTSGPLPIFLGSTSKFFFLYYPERKETEIVPIENTTMITLDSRRRVERKADSALARKGDIAAQRRLLRP